MEKKRCPSCNSTQVYVRIGKGELVCRGCGSVTKIDSPTVK